jgi:hypothetical protein
MIVAETVEYHSSISSNDTGFAMASFLSIENNKLDRHYINVQILRINY